MKRRTLLDMIGVLGVVITTFTFIKENLPPIYKTGGIIISVVLIGFYVKYYIEDSLEEEVDKRVEKKMKPLKSKIDRLEGWKDAVAHFFPKNKDGRLDPITLIVVLIIIIVIILYLQGKI